MLNPEEDEDQDEDQDEDDDESADPHPQDDARDLEVNRTWFGYSTDE